MIGESGYVRLSESSFAIAEFDYAIYVRAKPEMTFSGRRGLKGKGKSSWERRMSLKLSWVFDTPGGFGRFSKFERWLPA